MRRPFAIRPFDLPIAKTTPSSSSGSGTATDPLRPVGPRHFGCLIRLSRSRGSSGKFGPRPSLRAAPRWPGTWRDSWVKDDRRLKIQSTRVLSQWSTYPPGPLPMTCWAIHGSPTGISRPTPRGSQYGVRQAAREVSAMCAVVWACESRRASANPHESDLHKTALGAAYRGKG